MEAVKSPVQGNQNIDSENQPVIKQQKRHFFNKKRMTEWGGNAFCHIVLIGIIFLILFPFIQKIMEMFLSQEDLIDKTVKYIPKHFSLYTLWTAIGAMDYWHTLLNTVILCLLVATIQTLVCTFVSYGFARFKFPGRNVLFALVMLVLLIPPQVIMTTIYMQFNFFNLLYIPQLITGGSISLIDTLWPFVILSITALGFKNSLYIYMMRQFFRGMPQALEEAGMIDGCSHFGIFFRVMLPNAVPMMVTVFLFSFSWQWTDSYYSSLLLGNSYKVITNTLYSLETWGKDVLEYTPAFRQAVLDTGILLAVFPLVILYLIGQKFFVQGVAQSGIVG